MPRLTEQYILEKDKLEVSSFLIYKKEYRELSSDAKFLYQYLLKRFSVSLSKMAIAIDENTMENFTFVDDNGEVFCFCSNTELVFVMGVSEKTIIKAKKELKSVGLLEEVKQTSPKNNRIYVHTVVMESADRNTFNQELNAYKVAEFEKRKAKNAKRNTQKVSPAKKPEKPLVSTEPQNLQFSEPQNGKFMNCKISSHSTKESKSTKEPKSTKESISPNVDTELNDIEYSQLPKPVQKVISLNKKRLTDDNISVTDIYTFYRSSDNTVPPDDFPYILNNVLTKTKGSIKSFNHLMKKTIKNHYDEYTAELMPNIGNTYDEVASTSTFDPTKVNPFSTLFND